MTETRKPSLYATEKRLIRRFPDFVVIGGLLTTKLLSFVPNSDRAIRLIWKLYPRKHVDASP